ncbi:MAG: cyclomaltodextrinase [Psychromonas sp.]|jgi:cyclomaltodextrinase|uniref:alpha-amylase family glycosyl hydrolase n=1 Tax=Psychromonas sp. TaxID=1884585 RepID=UPI0039E43C4D
MNQKHHRLRPRSNFAMSVLAASITLVLAGCNSSSTEPQTPDPESVVTVPVVTVPVVTVPVVTEPVVTVPVEKTCIDNPLGDTDLYLRGGFNGWTAPSEYMLNYVCNRFELVTELTGTNTFKVADSSWSETANFGSGADPLVADTAVLLALAGGNIDFTFTGMNRVVLDVSESVETPKLTIESCPNNPFPDTTFFLRGGFNDWTASSDEAFTYSCDGFYLNVDETGDYGFKVADSGWSPALSFSVTEGESGTLEFGETFNLISDELAGSSANLNFAFTGEHTVKLAFDENGQNPTLTIAEKTFAGNGDVVVTDPIALSTHFDSRSLISKAPFGAVTEGTKIDLSLDALPGIDGVTLVVETRLLEGNQDLIEYTEVDRIPLDKAVDGDNERWNGSYSFDNKAIYGYYFEVSIGEQTFIYENNNDGIYWTTEKGSNGTGVISAMPSKKESIRRYRQTVYAADFKVPEWANDAVYYYIFPERFRNGDLVNDPTPGKDSYLDIDVEFHNNWNDTPWVPDARDAYEGDDEAYNNDFFGGDLAGVIEKLDYMVDLGINTIYFNPLFEAPSNHKYDTADYMNIDDNFGDNALFAELVKAAATRNIRVILDTSLNHTGNDSVYFDRYGKFPGVGAFEGGVIQPESPYASWYQFFPENTELIDQYLGWVGVETLPELVESDSWKAFAYGNSDSVSKFWLDMGIDGWRMDVAPWVSDQFWREWRTEVKAKNPDAITVAETWFDASKYFLGDTFDSTMNYIFRNTVLDYAAGGDAATLYNSNMEMMRENYPEPAFYALMNLLSTHDAARALHQFGYLDESTAPATIAEAKQRLKLAVLFQMTYPGAPSIFYGDEVGVTGGDDPFNRATYPWADTGGEPDNALFADFQKLIKLRNDNPVLRDGSIDKPAYIDQNVIVLVREDGGTKALVVLNNSTEAKPISFTLPAALAGNYIDALGGTGVVIAADGNVELTAPALFGQVLIAD